MSSYWRDDARCNPSNARLFDPINHTDRTSGWRTDRSRLAHAVAICRTCPVATRCLDEAIGMRDSGVRGGVLLEDGERIPLLLPVRAA